MIATQSDKRPARVRIFVLGGFRVVVDGRERRLRTRKEAVLLLRLALAGSAGVGRDDCMAMLWPDSSEARARHSLSEALRGVELGTGLSIERTPERVAVADDAIETDLHALDVALERGDIAEASRLYLGSFLAGWYPPTAEASHWVDGKAAAVESKLLKTTRARLDVMRAATDSRGVTAAVALLERLGAATDADREAAAEAEQITGWETLRAGEGVPSRLPIDREGPFVGRVEEMKVLTGELEKALAGELRVVLVSGEAGIGKTRICQRLARLAALRGCRLFMASCYELEQPIPFSAMGQVLSDRKPTDFARLSPHWQEVIRTVLPDGGEPVNRAETAGFTGMYAALKATTALFETLAHERCAFVLVDDTQWADATSCQILHHIVRCARADAGALLVVAHRDALPAESPAELLVRSLQEAGATNVHVARMTDYEVRAQLATLLASPTIKIDDLVTLSRGNPFMAMQLALASNYEHVHGSSLRDVLATRLAALDSDARMVLELLAVAGAPLRINQIAELAGSEMLPVVKCISRLTARGLVSESGAAVSVSHDLLRTAIYEGIEEHAVVAYHAALAHRLSKDLPAGSLARHLLKAGFKVEAREKALEEASSAYQKRAYYEEAEWLEFAVNASPEDILVQTLETAWPRLFALAAYTRVSAMLAKCARYLTPELRAVKKLADLKGRASSQATYTALLEESMQVFSLMDSLDMGIEAVDALRERIRFAQELGDIPTLQLTIDSLDEYASEASYSVAAYARAVCLMKLSLLAPERVRERLTDLQRQGVDHLPVHVRLAMIIVDALEHYHQGRLRTAGIAICNAIRQARRIGDLSFEHRARTLLVPIAIETGRYARAERHAAFVFTYAEFAGSTWERWMTQANLAIGRLEQGDLDGVENLTVRMADEIRDLPWSLLRTATLAMIGEAALAKGQVKKVQECMERIEADLGEEDWFGDVSSMTVFLARARRQFGRHRSAVEVLRQAARYGLVRSRVCFWNAGIELAKLGEGLDGLTPTALAAKIRQEAAENGCRAIVAKADLVLDAA